MHPPAMAQTEPPSAIEHPQDKSQIENTHQQTQSESHNGTADQQRKGADGKTETLPTSDRVMLELRKYILLLATLVATVTYAAGFSPPGDVWQDTAAGHLAGDPIIRDTHYHRYLVFFYCNATAFAASVVVIVLILMLASLDDKNPNFKIVGLYKKHSWITVRPLQAVMVLDLLSLMGAYAAGTCRDTFTTIYSSLLVGAGFAYLVVQVAVASWFTEPADSGDVPVAEDEGQLENADSGVVSEIEAEEEQLRKALKIKAEEERCKALKAEEERLKAQERLRKVLILLATFAVSITYVAGLSTPGGFWDSSNGVHGPGDAILKDRHDGRLAVFFGFNTMAFVASLLIIVVLLDRKLRPKNAYGFIIVTLISLIGAYTAGSCRKIDTTVYVVSLVGAVLVYIGFLQVRQVARFIRDTCKTVSGWWNDPETNSTAQPDQAEENSAAEEEEKSAAEKARSLVLLLATLAATITFQAGLDPPGGMWLDNGVGHKAGDPILLTASPRRYKAFFYCNSVSFVASLVAIILVQNQKNENLLLKHHALEATMILDLFGLIGAYAAGSCRDISNSIYAMALAGAVLVYVVIHVVFVTLDHKDDNAGKELNKVVEKTRKRLLLFAILAATITYQAGLTPPGGFRVQDDNSGHHAGYPVLFYNFPRRYKAFFYCNSVSFMLSIALIILLVNPNLYRPAIRSHALSVCTAAGLLGLMGAYAAGSTQYLKTSIYIFVLVGVVLFFVVLLFVVFFFKGKRRIGNGSSTSRGSTTQGGHKKKDAPLTPEDPERKRKEKRIHAKRKYLMLLGILVASITYQAGLEPPGGTWQSSGDGHEAGDPVLHDNRRPRYLAFFYSNSTSFMASIVVILLLLVPEKLLETQDDKRLEGAPEQPHDTKQPERLNRWLVVMNTTIVLDLLGLLVTYAAGSCRGWKTSLYVVGLVIAVLFYVTIHVILSFFSKSRHDKVQHDSSLIP